MTFPNLMISFFNVIKPSEYAFLTFFIGAVFAMLAFSQEAPSIDLKSFDGAVRDVKKTAVDFLSCFFTASFPVTVTTAFSLVLNPMAKAVDLGGRYA